MKKPKLTPARAIGASKKAVGELTIKNVLVPVDFSTPSLEAVEVALPLLKRFGAQLHLVHVFPPDYPLAAISLPVALIQCAQRGGL